MNRKIKVMYYVSGLISGGVEQMLYNYCKFMDHSKFEFIIVYQHTPVASCKEKLEDIGCKTIRITARSENFIENIFESYQIIKKYKPDIVHAHMNLMNFCPLLAAFFAGIKIRISHSHIAEKNKGVLFRIFSYICKKLNMLFANFLMTCGKEAGEYLYGKKKMETKKVQMVENAIELEYYKKDENIRSRIREQLGVENGLVVGHIGRFTKQKNHKRLIEIFEKLLELESNAYLLLVGSGELEDDIKISAKKKGIFERIIFYGTTKDMYLIYNAMDIFVLPSLYEGFPVVSVEVQAADVPSIFSDRIAQSCKLTSAIEFLSLDLSDEIWAEKIFQRAHEFRDEINDSTEFMKKYDIRYKAVVLQRYYIDLIKKYKE